MPAASPLPEQKGFAPEQLRGRVALRFFLTGLAVDATVIGYFATHPEAVAYFYSSQFPVLSRLIFAVFFGGLAITYLNFGRLLREEHQLRRAVDFLSGGTPALELRALLPACGVRDRLDGLLARPGQANEGDPAGQERLEAREETHAGWAKYITGVLTMLGLVGTFLGLMVAIDSIRGLTDLQDRDAFFQGVVGALDGMGTAFSTSLAGIFGAVVLGFEQLVFHFAQLSFLTRLQVLTERSLVPQLQAQDSASGLAVEIHRLRSDLRSWRTDAASAGVDLQAAASELGRQTRSIGESVGQVLDRIRENDDRWREVSEELAGLRRLAADENQALLALAGHRLAGARGGAETEASEGPAAEQESEAPAAEGGLPEASPDAPVFDQDPLLGELRRSNDLLAHIYREMGLVLRSASNRLEMRQTEALQALARVIQRMDAQAASSAEQIQMLRALLRYLNDDDRQLAGLMGVLRDEARREQDEEEST